MKQNRKPHEAARCSQVPTKSDDVSTSFPRNFGVENGVSVPSRTSVAGVKFRMAMSSRFGNNEMKWASCSGVQRGENNVSDRSVGDRCPRLC